MRKLLSSRRAPTLNGGRGQPLSSASVEDIAEAASYSRGAFYSNFKSKNDLFFEVLRQDEERTRAQLAAAVDDALPPDQVKARMLQACAALYKNADAFMAQSVAMRAMKR